MHIAELPIKFSYQITPRKQAKCIKVSFNFAKMVKTRFLISH